MQSSSRMRGKGRQDFVIINLLFGQFHTVMEQVQYIRREVMNSTYLQHGKIGLNARTVGPLLMK